MTNESKPKPGYRGGTGVPGRVYASPRIKQYGKHRATIGVY